ncbi:hypothetical protein [Actinokineospora sp. NPDC004072]
MTGSISRVMAGLFAAASISAAMVTAAEPAGATADACAAYLAGQGHTGEEFTTACEESERGDLESCFNILAQNGLSEDAAVQACVLAAA